MLRASIIGLNYEITCVSTLIFSTENRLLENGWNLDKYTNLYMECIEK